MERNGCLPPSKRDGGFDEEETWRIAREHFTENHFWVSSAWFSFLSFSEAIALGYVATKAIRSGCLWVRISQKELSAYLGRSVTRSESILAGLKEKKLIHIVTRSGSGGRFLCVDYNRLYTLIKKKPPKNG